MSLSHVYCDRIKTTERKVQLGNLLENSEIFAAFNVLQITFYVYWKCVVTFPLPRYFYCSAIVCLQHHELLFATSCSAK